MYMSKERLSLEERQRERNVASSLEWTAVTLVSLSASSLFNTVLWIVLANTGNAGHKVCGVFSCDELISLFGVAAPVTGFGYILAKILQEHALLRAESGYQHPFR